MSFLQKSSSHATQSDPAQSLVNPDQPLRQPPINVKTPTTTPHELPNTGTCRYNSADLDDRERTNLTNKVKTVFVDWVSHCLEYSAPSDSDTEDKRER